jgi:shikimate kinase
MNEARCVRARLVIVSGPIASGKSTVSRLLADRLVRAGFTVATVDVDDVAAMARAPGGLSLEHWQHAHEAHGALVGGWLASPMDVVVAHGAIFTRRETDALMSKVPAGTPVMRVLLRASYEIALARVSQDADRGLSKDPGFLRRTHDRFAAVREEMDPFDPTFDTDVEPAESIAARITSRLIGDGG